jgi:nucleoside-diphosphate-sugar epimerase
VLDETSLNLLETYRRSNVEVTRRLAEQASAAGVRRFVFLSSIKVNGETTPGTPFSESTLPAPQDAYGISKLEAENVLRTVCDQSKMEWVVLRPPLVYGPGVKGNFLRLMNLIARGVPLPLASIRNQRSLIHVDNLADAIVACIDTPAAAGRHWLISDGRDISTPDLIRILALGLNRRARLLHCPVTLLHLGAAFLRQRAAIARLTGSLAVDSSALRQALGWKPRIQLDQGLIDTARWYHQTQIQRGF